MTTVFLLIMSLPNRYLLYYNLPNCRLTHTYLDNNPDQLRGGCGSCEEALTADTTKNWGLEDCSTCNFDNCNRATGVFSGSVAMFVVFWLHVLI